MTPLDMRLESLDAVRDTRAKVDLYQRILRAGRIDFMDQEMAEVLFRLRWLQEAIVDIECKLAERDTGKVTYLRDRKSVV